MFQLCEQIGCPHPDYLYTYLTSSQITEWMAYDRISPIGGKRLDFHFAHLLSSIFNIASSIHSEKKTTTKVTDFIPIWEGEDKAKELDKNSMSSEEILQFFQNIKQRTTKESK